MRHDLCPHLAEFALGIGECVRIPIEDRDPRSLAGERDRTGAPDPGPTATHHDRLVTQLEIHACSSSLASADQRPCVGDVGPNPEISGIVYDCSNRAGGVAITPT